MKKIIFVLAACALVGMSSCERAKKAAAGKQKRIVKAEAAINTDYIAGDWIDSTKNAVVTLEPTMEMSGKIGNTRYSGWDVAHEDMLLFYGERDGQNVVDTAMLNAQRMPEQLTVAATGHVYSKKHEQK